MNTNENLDRITSGASQLSENEQKEVLDYIKFLMAKNKPDNPKKFASSLNFPAIDLLNDGSDFYTGDFNEKYK